MLLGSSIISYKYKLFLVILSLVGAGIILLSTKNYGAGISPDSVGYIAAARNIATGKGVITYTNAPLILQPPLYPFILGTIDLFFGIDPLLSANIVNAILFGVTLYLSGQLLIKYFPLSPVFALLGTLCLLVSTPLVIVSLMTWSELVFIFFVILYFVSLFKYSEKKDIKSLLLLASSVALASLTRYIGVIFILTGLVSILLIQREVIRTKYSHIFIFLLVSTLPISIWVGRNYFLSGTLLGTRSLSLHPLGDNITYTIKTMMLWYFPDWIVENRWLLAPSFIIIFIGAVIVCNRMKISIIKLLKPANSFIIFSLFVIIGYIGLLIFSSTTTNYDPINNRLLSPVVIPLTFLVLSAIEILYKSVKVRLNTKTIDYLIMIGITLFLIVSPAIATTKQLIYHLQKGGDGYNGKSWRGNHTVQFIRENDFSDCTIYSNGADVLYLLADIIAKPIPARSSGATILVNISSLKGTFPEENEACLVWFDQITPWRPYIFTPEQLATVTTLDEIMGLDDGTIYLISKE